VIPARENKEPTLGSILYRLGRVLQLIGMVMLPLAIAGNLSPKDPLDLKTSLLISGVGITVFLVGYLLTNAGQSK
jgi:hypothetical protein